MNGLDALCRFSLPSPNNSAAEHLPQEKKRKHLLTAPVFFAEPPAAWVQELGWEWAQVWEKV